MTSTVLGENGSGQGASALAISDNRIIDPEYITAANALESGDIPPYAIRSHPGKGGNMFKYISHVWAAKQVRAYFNYLWSFQVVSAEVYDDNSSSAICRLSVYLPMKNGGFFEHFVQEIGPFDDVTRKMPKAMRLAAAVSRGFVRCLFRMFGLGEEFYEKEGDPTPEAVWTALLEFGKARGVEKEKLIAALKEKGFTAANLLDRAAEAYEIVATLAGTRKPTEELPIELGGTGEAPKEKTPVENPPAEPTPAPAPKAAKGKQNGKHEPKPLDWVPASYDEMIAEFMAQGRNIGDIRKALAEKYKGKRDLSKLAEYYRFIMENMPLNGKK